MIITYQSYMNNLLQNLIHILLVISLNFVKMCDPSKNLFHTFMIKITCTPMFICDIPTLGIRLFTERIGCSSLRGGGGELGTNKNLDLWLQIVCTKLKLKYAI